MRVRSTPHILNRCVRGSNFGALRAGRASALGEFAVMSLRALQLRDSVPSTKNGIYFDTWHLEK